MRLFSHGGACGDSCCLRVQNLSVTIGGDHDGYTSATIE